MSIEKAKAPKPRELTFEEAKVIAGGPGGMNQNGGNPPPPPTNNG